MANDQAPGIYRRRGALMVLLGFLANNLAFLHDPLFSGMEMIIMGPKSYTLAAIGGVLVLVGLCIVAQQSDEPGAGSGG